MKATVAAPPPLSRSLPAVILLALVLAAGNAMLGVFSAVQEAAKAELALSDTQLGLLQGLAVSLPLAALSIPVGIAVDRANRVRLLLATSAAWTIGTLLTVWSTTLPALFTARMLAGLGANISTTIAISLAADLCLPAQRGRTLLLLTVGKYGGTALAFALGGWLFGHFAISGGWLGLSPWRAVHLVLGLGSAVLTLSILALREPPRLEAEAGQGAPLRVVAAELWARRAFLAPLFLGQLGVFMADASAGIWAAPVLQRRFGLAPQDFAGWLGALIFASGILGALLGGFAGDWALRRGGGRLLLQCAAIAALAALPAALFPLATNLPAFAAALFVMLLGGTVTGLITATALAVLLPNELRGLCIGSFVAFAGLIAFGAGPTLVTLASTGLGGEQWLGLALGLVGLAVSALGLAGFVGAMRHAPQAI